MTFSKFLNTCKLCNGTGIFNVLNLQSIIDNEDLPITELDCFNPELRKVLKPIVRFTIKPSIKRFSDEGLFDLSLPIKNLNCEAKKTLLYGYKSRRFLKKGGKPNALRDYISWKGLDYYIRESLKTLPLPIKECIMSSSLDIICPDCESHGFEKEVPLYQIDGVTLIDKLLSRIAPGRRLFNPDCQNQNQNQNNDSDECEALGYYNDGVCDDFCAMPDPDCQSQNQNQNQNQNNDSDECEALGYYNDGVCDEFCTMPDPDCQNHNQNNTYDECESEGYYGDGVCDDFCAEPDPDCY